MAIQLHSRTDFEGDRRAREAANKRAYILGFAQPILQSVLGALAQKWARQPTELEGWRRDAKEGITSRSMFEPVPDAPAKVGEAVQRVSPVVTRGPEMPSPPTETREGARISRRGPAGIEPPPDFAGLPSRMLEVHPEKGALGTERTGRIEDAVRLPTVEDSPEMAEYRKEQQLREKTLEEQGRSVRVPTERVKEAARPYHAAATLKRRTQEASLKGKLSSIENQERSIASQVSSGLVNRATAKERIHKNWHMLINESDPANMSVGKDGSQFPVNLQKNTKFMLWSKAENEGRTVVDFNKDRHDANMAMFGDSLVEVSLTDDEIEMMQSTAGEARKRAARDTKRRRGLVTMGMKPQMVSLAVGDPQEVRVHDLKAYRADATAGFAGLSSKEKGLINKAISEEQDRMSQPADQAFINLSEETRKAIATWVKTRVAASEPNRLARLREIVGSGTKRLPIVKRLEDLREKLEKLDEDAEKGSFIDRTKHRVGVRLNPNGKKILEGLDANIPAESLWSGKFTHKGREYALHELFVGYDTKSTFGVDAFEKKLKKAKDAVNKQYDRVKNHFKRMREGWTDEELFPFLGERVTQYRPPGGRRHKPGGSPFRGTPRTELARRSGRPGGPQGAVAQADPNRQKLEDLFNKINAMNVPASSKRRRFLAAAGKLGLA